MAIGIHTHKCHELQETWIDFSTSAIELIWNNPDKLFFKPRHGFAGS